MIRNGAKVVDIDANDASVKPRHYGLLRVIGGGMLGCLVYGVCAVLTMALAPRRAENLRDVVDLPWAVYVTLPTALAGVVLCVVGLLGRRSHFRPYGLFAAGLAVVLCTYFMTELLRRDYIGEF